MKRFLFPCIAYVGLALAPGTAAAQDPAAEAAAIAERRENEERYKRMNATIEDMKDAYLAYQKRVNLLVEEVGRLREENQKLREEHSRALANYVTRDDLRKLAEKAQEIEAKREADKKLILEEIQKLARVAATPPSEPKFHAPVTADSGDSFYTYEVQPGNTLSAILTAYNAEMKKQGKPTVSLDQVLKANPNLKPENLNKLRVGQKILIPLPAK